jgi:hypothetical protein
MSKEYWPVALSMRVMNFITATTFTLITALTPLVVVTVTEQVPRFTPVTRIAPLTIRAVAIVLSDVVTVKVLSSAYSGEWSP